MHCDIATFRLLQGNAECNISNKNVCTRDCMCVPSLTAEKKQFLVFEFGTLAIFLMLSAQGLIGFLLYTRAESWRLHSSSYFGENGHNFKTLYLVQDEKSVEKKFIEFSDEKNS